MVLLAQAQHSVCLSNFPSIFPHKNLVCSSGGALINLWEAVVLFLNFLFLGLDPVWENYSGDVKGIIVVGVVQIHTSRRFKMSSEFMVAGNSLLLSFSEFIIFSQISSCRSELLWVIVWMNDCKCCLTITDSYLLKAKKNNHRAVFSTSHEAELKTNLLTSVICKQICSLWWLLLCFLPYLLIIFLLSAVAHWYFSRLHLGFKF